ncbi:DUF5129 domain-containing protein [Ornithinimicrobium pratense]|uniref:DUF5129 domain-containing protein n=1 Tax=Ornithinimicrobium pratense TaxID=2593973 RepID=A0A5J6V4M7_9MICO|nr:DUF5129 domain-containing protein [Ornithinimicrobium pratense]QFG68081.1 DUF5129 domain-containing protein [Ornithinimicrobium pratense]
MSNLMRALVGGAASLGVMGTGVGLYAAQAPEHAASQVVVDDGAEILHEPTLREGIDGLRFHEPTDVAVFTHRGGAAALTDDRALNDAVLAHARESRTEWLSGDEQKWADDLYIFAVDPEGRLVGTYFGENRAVDEEAQMAIQDATKDDLGAGRWTEGAIVGVEEAADRMNAPFMRTTGGITVATVGSLAVLGGAGTWLGVGLHRARRSRAARAEGDERMANVVRDYETTELHARLIPEGSRYGGLMLRRYDEYQQGFRELTDLGNEARSIPERHYNRADSLERLTAYRDKARELDRLDDVIADTAALLNRDQAWPLAWQRQESPVREDLGRVGPMLDSDEMEDVRGRPEAQELREFASRALTRLDQLRGDLESRAVSPDDALDELRQMRDELSGCLDKLAGAVTEGLDAMSERKLMEHAMSRERGLRRHEPTILSTTNPMWTWYTVAAFTNGHSRGTSEVEQARAPSSGGSSSGYSGGGSFSGSGSSSRF